MKRFPARSEAASRNFSATPVARAGLTLTFAAAFALLGWLGWLGAETRDQARQATQTAVRVAELRVTIVDLDEWLTMSAEMAAATGDRRWAERYRELAPKLDAAISEASEIATREVRQALAETTGEAHRDLVAMERRSLELAADGDLKAARALLDSPEFDYLKGVYAGGVEVFAQDVKILAEARASDLDGRLWMEAGGLGVIAILLVAMALGLRGRVRFRGATARAAAVARTDALTDLPNRKRFYEVFGAALADFDPVGIGYALLLVDLDRFSVTNDAHGHPAGDVVLQLVAARLRELVRVGDLVARLDGDEFALLIGIGSTAQVPHSGEAAQAAERIVDVLDQPFALADGVVVRVGASVGVALAQPGSETLDAVMQRAHIALSRAKTAGRGCFRFFEHGMDVAARERARLEAEVRQAVAEDAIVPHFQPLVDLRSGRLIGVEMLARWSHPTRGMVSPAEFIPIVEELGLIGAMTVSLLRQGCRAAANWPDHVTLACNVSPLQLSGTDLPGAISKVLVETGFPARRLEVEVTESALVGDLALARRLLDEIKSLGVRLALDDFGTGYSSLRHLQVLPFDKLKIDQSFVGNMVSDRESAKIVSAVVGLGHSLGLLTVAEGIETEAVAELLRALGCDIGQGWFFGRPVPARHIDALVAEAETSSAALVA